MRLIREFGPPCWAAAAGRSTAAEAAAHAKMEGAAARKKTQGYAMKTEQWADQSYARTQGNSSITQFQVSKLTCTKSCMEEFTLRLFSKLDGAVL